MKLLLVEDDLSLSEEMAEAFKSEGFKVKAVNTGGDVLDLLDTEYHPDVVILDLCMPDITGAELLTQIKKWDNLLVYIYSGYVSNTPALSSLVRGCFRKGKHGIEDIIKTIKKDRLNFQKG